MLVQGLLLLYNLLLAGWFIIRWQQGDRYWWLWVGNALLPFFFAPMLFFVPAILVRRRWIAGLVLPTALFIANYGLLFLPSWPAASAARTMQPRRVMTFNVLFANQDYPAIARMISEEAADVVALQEVEPALADLLRARFAEEYPYQAWEPRSGPFGMAVLSRLPLGDRRIVVERPWGVAGLATVVETTCGPIQLLAMHTVPTVPGLSPAHNRVEVSRTVRERREEIQDALAYLGQRPGPTLLVGDFNLTDQHETYRAITQGYRDSFREVGWGFGFTFPARRGDLPLIHRPYHWPILRIDYVFHSPDLRAQATHVGPENGGSDHRPLVADIMLPCSKPAGPG